MKGKILDYNIQNSSGIISGDDGNRYEFTNSEWKSDKAPKVNQYVDFEADGKEAKSIYLDNSGFQFDIDDVKSKIGSVANAEVINNIKSKGMQNKLGFILSILTAISLFLPIMEVPLLGDAKLINDFMGKVLFVLLLISAFLFYSGMKHIFVKVCVSAIALIVFFQFYDLFTGLDSAEDAINIFGGMRRHSNVNLFELLKFGTPIIIILTIVLTFVGFKKSYKEA